MSVVSIVSIKGGTGKTTTALNLGAALAANHGKKILLIDSDSQGNLTKALGQIPAELKYTLANLMTQAIDDPDMLPEFIDRTIIHKSQNLDFIPANKRLADVLTRLIVMQTNRPLFGDDLNSLRSEFVLKAVVDAVKTEYDYVIIDCGPNRDQQMLNVLTAADEVIVPVQAHFLDAEGLPDTLEMIRMVKNALNSDLKILGVLLTMFRSRTKLAQAIQNEVENSYGMDVPVFSRQIDYSVRVAEHPIYGQSIFEYDPKNPAALAYDFVAEEVISNG